MLNLRLVAHVQAVCELLRHLRFRGQAEDVEAVLPHERGVRQHPEGFLEIHGFDSDQQHGAAGGEPGPRLPIDQLHDVLDHAIRLSEAINDKEVPGAVPETLHVTNPTILPEITPNLRPGDPLDLTNPRVPEVQPGQGLPHNQATTTDVELVPGE